MAAMVVKHEAAISSATKIVTGYYDSEMIYYQTLIEQYKKPLQTHIVVDGNRTREFELSYWRASMKSMMRTTAQVATDVWEYAMNYMEETSEATRSTLWQPPTEKNLKEMRTDAALVGQICAGIDVAKARWLLTFFIDETELECSSLQSMMLTIVDEDARVRNITLDGVTLLAMKTAEAATDATISTFTTTREMLAAVRDMYIEVLKGDKHIAGMEESDWIGLFGEREGDLSYEEMMASADEQFGDPARCDERYLLAGSSDHCAGAQAALFGFKAKVKNEAKVSELYGDLWAGMSPEDRAIALSISLYGCQHHLRNICFGRGHKAVEPYVRALLAEG